MTLEVLWRGAFGDAYHDRCRDTLSSSARSRFWHDFYVQFPVKSVLEPGCGLGANLRWAEAERIAGCDVNVGALQIAIGFSGLDARGLDARIGSVLAIPFDDAEFELVFTCGLLIHVSPADIRKAMRELMRVSSRYVMVMEYEAEEEAVVPYRGQDAALWKRPYARMISERGLKTERQWRLDKEDGFDRVTATLFSKKAA